MALVSLMACHDDKPPRVLLSRYAFDFGEVAEGVIILDSFKVYNKGGGELYIRRVVGDCNCTTAAINKHVLPKGDSTTIHFKLDTKGKIGDVEQCVIIEANTDSTIHYIMLRANVI